MRLIILEITLWILLMSVGIAISNVMDVSSGLLLVITSALSFLITRIIGNRRGWKTVADTSTITEESLQNSLMHFLIGFSVLTIPILLYTFLNLKPDLLTILVFGSAIFIGLAWMIYASIRYYTWIIAARKNPALVDERIRANQKISDKLAFVGCFGTAVILGLLDFMGWVPLSGAIVGISAGIAGLFVGLASQYWLEMRDE